MKWYQNRRYYSLYFAIIIFVLSIIIYKTFSSVYSLRHEDVLEILRKVIILATLYIGGFLAYRPIKGETHTNHKAGKIFSLIITALGALYVLSVMIYTLSNYILSLQSLFPIVNKIWAFSQILGINVFTILIVFLIYITPEREIRMKFLIILLLYLTVSYVIKPFVFYLFNMIGVDLSVNNNEIVISYSLVFLLTIVKIILLINIGRLYDSYKKKMIISWIIYLVLFSVITMINLIIFRVQIMRIKEWVDAINILNIISFIPYIFLFIFFYKAYNYKSSWS